MGRDRRDTLIAAFTVGHLLYSQGKKEQAESLYRQTMVDMRRIWGDEHVDTLNALSDLGTVHRHWGRLDEALDLSLEVVESGRRSGQNGHRLGSWLTEYGRTLTARAGFDKAEAVLEEALDLLQQAGPASLAGPGATAPTAAPGRGSGLVAKFLSTSTTNYSTEFRCPWKPAHQVRQIDSFQLHGKSPEQSSRI